MSDMLYPDSTEFYGNFRVDFVSDPDILLLLSTYVTEKLQKMYGPNFPECMSLTMQTFKDSGRICIFFLMKLTESMQII